MASLDDLDRRIRQRFAASEERRHAEHQQLRRSRDELEERLARYTRLADRLMNEVIRPRMGRLAGHFENAHVPAGQGGRHSCVYLFERSPRFPAVATLELGLTRDGQVRTLVVEQKVTIVPAFGAVPLPDVLVLPLEGVDEERVAAWVEEKLLAFLDAYLPLETAEPDQGENGVTDPVCGMSLTKARAPAQMEYGGVVYYFCVEECRRRFAEAPERYLPAGSSRH
jgi:YHS domain-containing protein